MTDAPDLESPAELSLSEEGKASLSGILPAWQEPIETIASLVELAESPLHRGCIDSFDDGMLEGWSLSGENPMATIGLELWVAGVRVAKLTTGTRRQDVARIVRLPIRPGFQFDIATVQESKAQEALAALRALKAETVKLEDLISVQIEGTTLRLPLSESARAAKVSISRLADKFALATGRASGNRRVTDRRILLEKYLAEPTASAEVKVVAYYLPQFHPFPENDEWWGTGFTEWTNVIAAKPLFPGHHQPQLPADLGFYDLRLDQVQRDQVELAKRYGISGFCYYYYWFSGKTLMTLPIDRHVEQDLDIDFCLCWANESWSRRWDGSENDVLIGQAHTYDSDVDFIYSCLPYFKSKRYIKINGAPLLQIYRISLMERPRETLERWRQIARSEGFPDLHVCMVESFGLDDPHEFGCDSSCQFPPHGVVGDKINDQIEDLAPDFTGTIYSYPEIVRGEIARPRPPHLRFRTAMPSWDNSARKGAGGNIFAGAGPAMFETWMRHLVADARNRLSEGQRFVFVNAWNEWAEGTHLEPDRKFGHANLRAVRNALSPESLALAPLLPPLDGSEDRLAETRRLVESLMTANRELTRLVSQPKFGMRVGEELAFVPVPASFVTTSQIIDGKFNIDSLNGRGIQRDTIFPIGEWQGIGLKGWLVTHGHPPSTLFVGLRRVGAIGAPQRYIASIHVREPRHDVVEAFGLDLSWLYCGFSLRAALRGVSPGHYEIELICGGWSSPDAGRVLSTGIHLQVG